MSTAQHCREMADEADRLASIVSYARDKVRLKQQADSWRARAEAMESPTPPRPQAQEAAGGVRGWLRRRCS